MKLYTKEISGCGECPNSAIDAYGVMCRLKDKDDILDLNAIIPDWCPLPDKVESAPSYSCNCGCDDNIYPGPDV